MAPGNVSFEQRKQSKFRKEERSLDSERVSILTRTSGGFHLRKIRSGEGSKMSNLIQAAN